MPLENSSTQGSKGNNSNYQSSVINLLKQIVAASGGGSGGSGALNTAAKGSTVVGNPTSRSKSANVTALDVQIVDAAGNQITNFGGTITNDGTFATPALQTSGNASLVSLDNKMPTAGQKTSAGSSPVVLSSDQSAIPINIGTTSLISTVNTYYSPTGTPLNANQTYTGTSEDVSQYALARVFVLVDQDSALNGLLIQNSAVGGAGNAEWASDFYTVKANSALQISVPIGAKFFRVKYTNGAVAQSYMQLSVTYKKVYGGSSSVRPQDGRSNDNDMEENISYISSYDPNTDTWNRIQTQDLYVTGQSAQTAVVSNILTTTAGSAATDLLAFRSFAVQVISTGTAGTFIFEGSNDNVNFQSIPVFNQALAVPIPIVTAITPTVSQIIYVGGVTFRYIRLRIVTTITGGSIQAFAKFSQKPLSVTQTIVAQGTAANLNTTVSSISTSIVPGTAATNLGKARAGAVGGTDTGVGMLVNRNDTLTVFAATSQYVTPVADKYGTLLIKDQYRQKQTYSTSFNVNAGLTAADIFQLIGSASKVVMIQRITVSANETTAGQILLQIQKRSAANTGGTSSASISIPHDSANAAATAVGTIYTANPTPGTSLGSLVNEYIPVGSSTVNGSRVVYDFGDRGQPIVLTGTAQALAIVLGGTATPAGLNLAIRVEFTEE